MTREQSTAPLLLTPAEAAHQLRVSVRTLYRMVEQGQIAVLRTAGMTRIPASTIRHMVGAVEAEQARIEAQKAGVVLLPQAVRTGRGRRPGGAKNNSGLPDSEASRRVAH
jgi:excisionase family DNA binding protein